MEDCTDRLTPQTLQQIYTVLYSGDAATAEEIAAHTGLAPPLVEAALDKLIELQLIKIDNVEELRYGAVAI